MMRFTIIYITNLIAKILRFYGIFYFLQNYIIISYIILCCIHEYVMLESAQVKLL